MEWNRGEGGWVQIWGSEVWDGVGLNSDVGDRLFLGGGFVHVYSITSKETPCPPSPSPMQ